MKLLCVAKISLLWVVCLALPINNAFARPVCESPGSDPDGDGFGWENGATCLVNAAPVSSELPICRSASSDSNGDGFGWENSASCRVASVLPITPVPTTPTTRPTCQSTGSDPDGDGFGWENNATCVVQGSSPVGPDNLLPEEKVRITLPACSDNRYRTSGNYGWENSRSCTFANAGNSDAITDVILITGQSNALGAESGRFDPDVYVGALDSPVKRVYAYSKNGWGIADLRQIWDQNWYPRGDIANDPANNFAFHFGKQLVRHDASKVVGIIMITAPGEAIDHWNRDGAFFAAISTKVEQALAALPGDLKVQGVLWHQGETDYYGNDYYTGRLNTLIDDFRSRAWFADDGVFVCGETLNAPVNDRLARLNNDGDARTGCVGADDLTSVGDDVHFDAKSLRTLGDRYADKYQSLMR